MKTKELFSCIDHTQLNPCATWPDIRQLCEEALRYEMASVCIPGCYVKRAREAFPGVTICTVIGFPLGYCSAEAKLEEARQAVADGADEIDMVINLCDVKNGDYGKVEEEIAAVRQAVADRALKVIIETCYLDRDEKIAMCHAVTNAGADYIKTSTGFGTAGASLDDVCLMREHVGEGVKIKAAGGIRGREDMERYVKAGCGRIGTSGAIAALAKESAGQDGWRGRPCE